MYEAIVIIIVLILLVVLTAIVTSMGKKNQQEAAKFKDFKFPVPDEGAPQAVIFGDVWTSDWQVLWYGNMKSEPIYNGGGGKK